MSFTLSNETAGPEGERGWAVDITLDITPKYPTERVCVLLYGEDGELLGREEFAPEAAPEKIPAGDAAYAVVEDHTRDDSGEKAVERLFIPRPHPARGLRLLRAAERGVFLSTGKIAAGA